MKSTIDAGRNFSKNTGKPQRNKGSGKMVYWLALLPILSVGLYLLLMSAGQTENFAVLGILVFLAAIGVWGICGALFARCGVMFLKSVLIANAFPIFAVLSIRCFMSLQPLPGPRRF